MRQQIKVTTLQSRALDRLQQQVRVPGAVVSEFDVKGSPEGGELSVAFRKDNVRVHLAIGTRGRMRVFGAFTELEDVTRKIAKELGAEVV